MRVTIEWDSYNDRRWSRPWIARVTAWPVGSRPAIAWGNYLGNGSGGVLEVEAEAGDVLRYGQKDGRGNGTINRYGIVLEDGSLLTVGEPTAKRYYLAEDRQEVLRGLLANREAKRLAQADFDKWCAEQRTIGGDWTNTPEYRQRTQALRDALSLD